MQWRLKALGDVVREWLVTIDSVPYVIGRSDNCDLKLIDKHISRHHTEIRMSGDLLWVRDLNSMNGTYVNQKKIALAEMLEPNDIISIGEYKLQVLRVNDSTSTTVEETIAATVSKDTKELSSIEKKIKGLLRDRNVIIHFQPIVRISDLTAVGYEILGRVADSELPSNPSELFDMAEWFGCGSDLSSLFREVGVDIGKNLPGSPLLFVNTSQLELLEMDGLLASLQKIRDIAPSQKIVLEINEKAAAGTNAITQLRLALEKLNIGLAFDDFGVGQTRLVELSTISPNYLKFDMSLIRQIHLAPKRLHQMISTFVTAAHDLGICTLAEGIECSEEAMICQQLGFDLAQGFFFGMPTPIDEIDTSATPIPSARTKHQTSSLNTNQTDGESSKKSPIVINDFSKTLSLE